MSIQWAVNAAVSAPGSIHIKKNLASELARDLAGEKATSTAYGKITNIFYRLANDEDVSKEEIEELGGLINQIPVQNRKVFARSIKRVQSLTRTNIDQQMRLSMLQDRLDDYENRPNVPRAIAMTSSYDVTAKEEMKNGKSQTT